MRARKLAPEDLWGLGEIASYVGKNKNVVSNWHMRYPDFPKPFVRLIGGSVWLRSEVIEWLTTDHTTTRVRRAKVSQ